MLIVSRVERALINSAAGGSLESEFYPDETGRGRSRDGQWN